MINVGITGGETDAAGELIRILLNHPDVILRTVAAPSLAGERVDVYHRGLIGDTDLRFSAGLDTDKLNCVFLLGEPWEVARFLETLEDVPVSRLESEEDGEELLHIIDLSGLCRDGSHGMVYGFAEHRRKAMVRGALRASIPSAMAEILELALFPMAKNHLLDGKIVATVELAHGSDGASTCPASMKTGFGGISQAQMSTRFDPVAPVEHRPDILRSAEEASKELRSVDPCFKGEITASLTRNAALGRGIKATVAVPYSGNIEELRRLYEEAYSDHAFAFVVNRAPEVADVANTNKCILCIEQENGDISRGIPAGVRITAVMDNLVKGTAGNAVHCMNLLFGLSERTGLMLKASAI